MLHNLKQSAFQFQPEYQFPVSESRGGVVRSGTLTPRLLLMIPLSRTLRYTFRLCGIVGNSQVFLYVQDAGNELIMIV